MKMLHCRTGSLNKSKICLPGRAPFPVILAIENGIFKIKREPRLCGRRYGAGFEANFGIFLGVVLNRIF